MPILLDPNKNFINIEIYYVEEQKIHGHTVLHFIKSEEEFKEWKDKGYQVKDPTKPINAKVINKLVTTWKRMIWKEQNSMYSKCIRQFPGAEGKDFDPVRYRELKLKNCLKNWDLTDEHGKPVELTEENIDHLDPSMALELIASFEKVTEPDEPEKKDS